MHWCFYKKHYFRNMTFRLCKFAQEKKNIYLDSKISLTFLCFSTLFPCFPCVFQAFPDYLKKAHFSSFSRFSLTAENPVNSSYLFFLLGLDWRQKVNINKIWLHGVEQEHFMLPPDNVLFKLRTKNKNWRKKYFKQDFTFYKFYKFLQAYTTKIN